MKTKEKIIEKIHTINDEAVLRELLEIIDLELGMGGDLVKVTDQQKLAIDEGLKNLDEGKFFSNNDARKITDEWLRKR